MTTAIPTVDRPARPTDVVALQYAVPGRTVVIPLGILAAVVVVMIVVTAAVVRAGGHGGDLVDNGAVVWSLTGFMIAVGVQGVSATFPLALALGTTRRTFTIGTLTSSVLEAAMITAAALLLLGVERLTGGWFVGASVLGDATLGGGNPLLLAAVVFGGTLTALAVGGLYGAAWIRFGAKGPAVVGLVSVALALVALMLLLAPIAAAIGALGVWSLVVAAAAVIVVATLAEHLLLRRASVR